jgi:hypothetical protein
MTAVIFISALIVSTRVDANALSENESRAIAALCGEYEAVFYTNTDLLGVQFF